MSPIDKTIFGSHFRLNDKLQPTRESLKSFLESPQKPGSRELFGSDLGSYSELVSNVQAFEHERRRDISEMDLKDVMVYGVLSHTHFAKRTLLSTVEHYKFYVFSLQTIDFKKPNAFIVSAEEEMSRLDPRRTSDAVKLARFREMIAVRKRTITMLNKRWTDLDAELAYMAQYVSSNLRKMAKLCELSIDILKHAKNASDIERRITEKAGEYLKEEKESPGGQSGRKQDRKKSKKKNDDVMSEAVANFQDDLNSLIFMYKSILEHAKKSIGEIDALLVKVENRKRKNIDDDLNLYGQLERVLVSLVSDHKIDVQKSATHQEKGHQQFLRETRAETIEHLFDLLQRERRRSSTDRRNDSNRRSDEESFAGEEQRGGDDRRSGKDRRRGN